MRFRVGDLMGFQAWGSGFMEFRAWGLTGISGLGFRVCGV